MNNNDDIVSKLDELIKQIKLTNALLSARLIDYDALKKHSLVLIGKI